MEPSSVFASMSMEDKKRAAAALFAVWFLQRRSAAALETVPREPKKSRKRKRAEIGSDFNLLDSIDDEDYSAVFGVTRHVFDYLFARLKAHIQVPRNVRCNFTDEENTERRERRCFLDSRHRFALWLEQMKHGLPLGYLASRYNWNETSIGDDFVHLSEAFIKVFDSVWICPLTEAQKQSLRGYCAHFPDALTAIDGKHFAHRRLHRLPTGTSRKEHFGHKHKNSVDNSAAEVCIATGICTELLTGVLGAIPDNCAARMMRCVADVSYDTLVDCGYRNVAHKCILPLSDGSGAADEHKDMRATVEHFWSRVSEWRIVGQEFQRSKITHPLAIRCAVILANVKIVLEFKPLKRC